MSLFVIPQRVSTRLEQVQARLLARRRDFGTKAILGELFYCLLVERERGLKHYIFIHPNKRNPLEMGLARKYGQILGAWCIKEVREGYGIGVVKGPQR